MQYILTEDEYNDLVSKATANRINLNESQLFELCIRISDFMPTWGWHADPYTPEPWGCIITQDKNQDVGPWVCDGCPVVDICPYTEKRFSK